MGTCERGLAVAPKKRKQREPSRASLREIPVVDFKGTKVRHNPYAAPVDDLRSAILKRPGMYFGDVATFGGFPSLFRSMALDAVQAGATRFSCRARPDGQIELRIMLSDKRVAELHSFKLGEAVSKRVEWSEANGQLGAVFVPDLDRFPYLAARSMYPLVGFVHDLSTAFPQCGFDVDDEGNGLHVALQFAGGCQDRLRMEAGQRSVRQLCRFDGESGEVRYDVALAWCSGPGLQVVSIVNGARSPNGGSHVQGVWEGIADALNERLKAEGISARDITVMDSPRNAVLVVSVHLGAPEYGPATRDCLHDERARHAVRNSVAEGFFAKLGEEAIRSATPPWQLLAGIHHKTSWLRRLPDELCDNGRPGERDPYHHHARDEL